MLQLPLLWIHHPNPTNGRLEAERPHQGESASRIRHVIPSQRRQWLPTQNVPDSDAGTLPGGIHNLRQRIVRYDDRRDKYVG